MADSNVDVALSYLRDEDILNLAQDLIRIPSPTEQEAECVYYLKSLLDREGFETIIQEVEPNRPQLIAFLRGSGGGRSLMLNGHLDNDSITESWQWDPYQPKIEGNKLWGAGVHNMKSGVAALLAAAIATKRSGIELKGDLVIACVVGELQGGRGTVFMLNSGIKTDMAVIPEPYSVRNIITKCVGVQKFAINTIGRSVHTSRRENGIDAIKKMRLVIDALETLDLGVTDPDFPGVPRHHVASIIGGRNREYDLAGPSNLADFCTIIVDLRYPLGIEPQEIDAKIVSMLDKIGLGDPNFRYEYEHPPHPRFRVGGTDMPPMNLDPTIEIAQILRNNVKTITGEDVENVGAVAPFSYCGNDTAHLQRSGIECCLFGPRGYPEDVEKHVRIDEMLLCARALTMAIVQVCA